MNWKKNWKTIRILSKMVFESIVADLLNRFVGEYVENLDKTQLKIGIWGGKFKYCFFSFLKSVFACD